MYMAMMSRVACMRLHHIYAAYVLGDTTWANDVAVACTTDTTGTGGSPDLVEMLDSETWDPGLAGALLFALQKLDPSAYAADIAVLTDWLKDTQNPDGSWSDTSTPPYPYQDTAWAIKGLGAVGECEAAIAGADYLVSTQTTDSGIYKTGGYWDNTPWAGIPGFSARMVWIDAEDAQGLAEVLKLKLQFDPSSSSIVAINTDATLKVRMTADGTPVEGQTVTFSSVPAGLTITPSAQPTDPNGYAQVTATSNTAGVYTVTATVCGVISDTWTLVVYDPKGMTAGGGWYYPLADDESTMPGTASFGFVAKYIKGSATGNLEFQYHVEDKLNLKSTSITWLVVSGSNAQFKGTATLNGVSGYYFRVIAQDKGEPGVGQDTFAIKIWDGDPDTDGTLIHSSHNTLAGGNIIVRTK